jgi:hypothetical protein
MNRLLNFLGFNEEQYYDGVPTSDHELYDWLHKDTNLLPEKPTKSEKNAQQFNDEIPRWINKGEANQAKYSEIYPQIEAKPTMPYDWEQDNPEFRYLDTGARHVLMDDVQVYEVPAWVNNPTDYTA